MTHSDVIPPHESVIYHATELTQGYRGARISFEYRPYSERSAADQADYDRLRESLRREGMKHPLITYQGHILIGMRRFEIMRELGQEWFPAIEIRENVADWWTDRPEKLAALKSAYYRD